MTKKALIIIDVQKYYINENTKQIPSKILKYIKSSNFDFILFTKFVNNKNTNMYKTFKWRKMFSQPDIDICEEFLNYISDTNVFQKDTYSAFKSKLFKMFLEENYISKLFLCGFDTDACILATAYEGFDLGYKIKIINELTASHSGAVFRNSGLNIINKNIQLERDN